MTAWGYLLWLVVCFSSGSLMFSYWIGLVIRQNITKQGDGNPGAINLWKAAGFGYGLAGIALDFLKGYVPIMLLVRFAAVSGYALVPLAAAAVLGHMFSPFLRGKGGKAIAVTFGVWSALTGFSASLAYAIILALLLLADRLLRRGIGSSSGKISSSQRDGYQVVLGMLLLTALTLVFGGENALALATFGLVNSLLLTYAHRRELRAFLRQTMFE